MTYKYLFQDKQNCNQSGEIKARDRAEAYLLLRKQGIRPYRVIGDDPFRWQPWAVAAGYVVLIVTVMVLAVQIAERAETKPKVTMSAEAAEEFRQRAEEAVYRAPDNFRYNVWKGVNARLVERGLEPIPRPEGLVEE